MNSLIAYESKFGNTHTVADIVGKALGSYGSAPVVDIESPDALNLDKVDLLVVGGPTQAHQMSPAMRVYRDALISKAGTGMRAAAFGTRLKGPGFLWGSAAKGIAEEFRRSRFLLVTPPQSFLVEGMKEPQLVRRGNAGPGMGDPARQQRRIPARCDSLGSGEPRTGLGPAESKEGGAPSAALLNVADFELAGRSPDEFLLYRLRHDCCPLQRDLERTRGRRGREDVVGGNRISKRDTMGHKDGLD